MIRDDFGFPLSRLLGSWSCCAPPGSAQLCEGTLPPLGFRLPELSPLDIPAFWVQPGKCCPAFPFHDSSNPGNSSLLRLCNICVLSTFPSAFSFFVTECPLS